MQILPIASGKGGVGKSLLSANLAIALGQAGKKVVLADLDLGASNLHLAIGQNVRNNSIGTYLTDKTSFQNIVEPTEYENVSFIAGDSQIPGLTYRLFNSRFGRGNAPNNSGYVFAVSSRNSCNSANGYRNA